MGTTVRKTSQIQVITPFTMEEKAEARLANQLERQNALIDVALFILCHHHSCCPFLYMNGRSSIPPLLSFSSNSEFSGTL